LRDEYEVLPPGENFVDRGELSGEADRFAHLGRLSHDVVSVDGCFTAVGLKQRGQDLHHSRFPGAIGAEQGEDGARGDAQIDAPEYRVVAVGLNEPSNLDG